MQYPIGTTLSPQIRPFSLDKHSLLLETRTHRTRSISLAVFTTAKGSRRLQSQKCISLAVAISKSWAVGWKASDAMALLLSVNQLSLPPWVRSQESQAVYHAVWDHWVSMYVPSPKLPTAQKWHVFNSNSRSNTSPCHDHRTVYSNNHKIFFTTEHVSSSPYKHCLSEQPVSFVSGKIIQQSRTDRAGASLMKSSNMPNGMKDIKSFT